MGEGSARRIDPRFDPRFQRGYVPDAAAAPAPPPPAAADGVAGAAAAAATSPDRDTRRASQKVTDAAADDAADRPGFAAVVAPFGDSGDAPADSDTTRGEGDGSPKPVTDEPGDAAHVDEPEHAPEPVDEPVDEASGDRWFWIAIGACLASIALGSVLYWLQASDPWMYTGSARSRDEETLSTFLNALSPALVQAGVVGAVAVLVTWAALGARRARGRS